jgi:hypothetical protein
MVNVPNPGACGCSRYRKLDGYWTCQLLENDGFEIQKRGEVVEVDKGGALRSGTKKVGRLEESRDVPMDQESGPV